MKLKILILSMLAVIIFPNLALAATPEESCKVWFSPGTSEYNNCLKQYSNSGSSNSNNSGGNTSTKFDNPVGVSTVKEVLQKLLTNLQSIIAFIAVIFIIIGGILYMTSAGDEKRITRAKACWTGAVIGLAIALAAPSFLTEILNILGKGQGSSVDTSGLTGPSLKTIVTNILNLLLSVVGIIAIISLVAGGGMYMTAYGDEKRIDTAKKIVTYSVIGIVVALGALVIVKQVNSLLAG